jgi:hypothetical protein
MLIDGSGAPPRGPVDIVIAGNRIESIRGAGSPGLPLRANREPRGADHEIDAAGMYVMPGFVDVHGHNGDPDKAPNATYGYRLWLAHGVTTVRGVSLYFGPGGMSASDRQRSAANTIVAPRLYDYISLGDWTQGDIETPEQARAFVRWAAAQGYHGIKLFNSERGPTTEAAIQEARRLRIGTVAHLGQGGVAEVNADRATAMGLHGITHFYGHFESLLRTGGCPLTRTTTICPTSSGASARWRGSPTRSTSPAAPNGAPICPPARAERVPVARPSTSIRRAAT